jgi:poly-beta-1,6-N-acetyl-D-glucosamine synthase
MGVGRNLAYKKELFFKMKGFASHVHINSGDDDLFVNEACTKTNTVISIETHTTSRVTRSFAVWAQQKARHFTTFKQYDSWSKYRLILLSTSQVLFFSSLLILLAFQFEPKLLLTIFAIRFVIQLLVFIKPFFVLDEKDLFFFFPFMELVLLVVYPIITLLKRFAYKKRFAFKKRRR